MAENFFSQFKNVFEGLEKGELSELVELDSVHIEQVRLVNGEKGDYVQFTVKEKPGFFYNGSNPVSNILIACIKAGVEKQLPNQAWRFKTGKSQKWGTDYIAMNAL